MDLEFILKRFDIEEKGKIFFADFSAEIEPLKK